MARKLRKQRVQLRFKRREQLKHHLRAVIVRSIAIALVIGFGAGLVTGGDSFLSRFLRRHTPQVSLSSSQALTGLPALTELPKNHLWLWVPGSAIVLQKRICRKFSAVRSLWVERKYNANEIVVHLEPRIPLVTWHGEGFDRNGVLFAITPGTWHVLPQANFLPSARKADLGQWLAQLAAVPELYVQVGSIQQNASETLELTLKSGVLVIWGPPVVESFARKVQTLERVLVDAHNNLGGAARADLRFFDQGRIIVRPKGVRGD